MHDVALALKVLLTPPPLLFLYKLQPKDLKVGSKIFNQARPNTGEGKNFCSVCSGNHARRRSLGIPPDQILLKKIFLRVLDGEEPTRQQYVF